MCVSLIRVCFLNCELGCFTLFLSKRNPSDDRRARILDQVPEALGSQWCQAVKDFRRGQHNEEAGNAECAFNILEVGASGSNGASFDFLSKTIY